MDPFALAGLLRHRKLVAGMREAKRTARRRRDLTKRVTVFVTTVGEPVCPKWIEEDSSVARTDRGWLRRAATAWSVPTSSDRRAAAAEVAVIDRSGRAPVPMPTTTTARGAGRTRRFGRRGGPTRPGRTRSRTGTGSGGARRAPSRSSASLRGTHQAHRQGQDRDETDHVLGHETSWLARSAIQMPPQGRSDSPLWTGTLGRQTAPQAAEVSRCRRSGRRAAKRIPLNRRLDGDASLPAPKGSESRPTPRSRPARG
jgi:hypothetical protein